MASRNATEQRRAQRVDLEPYSAAIGGLAVTLLDLSSTGAKIEHTFPLNPRRELALEFGCGDEVCRLACVVVRSRLQRSIVRPDAICYQSGLRFSSPVESSRQRVRELVASLLGDGARTEPVTPSEPATFALLSSSGN